MKIILTMPRSLLVGGNHIFHLYLFNICIRLLFFRLQIQNFPCSGRGNTPLPDPPPARSLRSFAIGPFARIWRKSYSTYICSIYASENCFFRLQIQNFPPLGRSAASQAVHSLGFSKPPNSQNILVTGL